MSFLKVMIAREMAQKAHGAQMYGAYPYMKHLDDVALLVEHRYPHTDAMVIAYLHDTLEDTDLTKAAIEDRFGRTVANAVDLLSDPKTYEGQQKSRKERKAAVMLKMMAAPLGWERDLAVLVKVADRVANVRNCIATKSPLRDMYRKEQIEFSKIYYPYMQNHLNDDLWLAIWKLVQDLELCYHE